MLVVEDIIVHLPELALRRGSLGGESRVQCMGVDLGEREVAIDKAQLLPELLLYGLHHPRRSARIGAFVVAVLHQRDRGGVRPLTMVSFADRDHKSCSLCHPFAPFQAALKLSSNPDRVSKVQPELVSVTPSPVLIWLEGLHDRVVGRVEMLGGMLILRLIAAADMPAFKADSQVYPGVADFQAILTPISARCDLTYLIKVTTLLCHGARFPFSF